ncbi:hypothetical protein AGMMS50218_12220 [Actinomycetota bacterium]|nr:hypothetical protein AGMMS50218_12220 [Actinomycetota bacterium]
MITLAPAVRFTGQVHISRSERVGDVSPLVRLLVGGAVGIGAGLGFHWSSGLGALLGGWAVAAAVYVGWTWLTLAPMDPAETAAHATREEPTRVGAHVVLVLAAVLSLVGVGAVLVGAERRDAQVLVAALCTVVASWAAVHTIFALRYARAYCTPPLGGIDFHQEEPPRYTDFAYTAFTVGMSFAISDTDLASSSMRRAALVHALLSYVFGTVVVALLVNLVAGLGA